MLTDELNGGFVRIVFRRATGKTDEGVNGPVNGSVNGPVNEKSKEALEIELETQLTRFCWSWAQALPIWDVRNKL